MKMKQVQSMFWVLVMTSKLLFIYATGQKSETITNYVMTVQL